MPRTAYSSLFSKSGYCPILGTPLFSGWWVVHDSASLEVLLPLTVQPARAQGAVIECFSFASSLLPHTIPRPPAMGRRTKTFCTQSSWFPGKMKGRLVSSFIPSLFLNKSVAWCILDDFLMKQIFMLLLFSCSLSSSLGPHGGLLCLLPSPGVCSNSCPIDFIQSTILKEQCNTLCEYTSNKFLFRWKDKEHVTNTLIM